MNIQIESLNVGVSAGITIYELQLKRIMAMLTDNIKSTLGRNINVMTQLAQRFLNKEISKISNFSSDQIIFLMVLKCDKQMNSKQIQAQFGLLDNQIQMFLKDILNKNLISIEDQFFKITEKGNELLGKLWPILKNTEEKILSELSSEEIHILKS